MLSYITKSVRAMVQLGASLVITLLAVILLFTTVSRWRFESSLRDGVQWSFTGDGDAQATLEDARNLRKDDPLPSLFLGQLLLDKGLKLWADAESGRSSDKVAGVGGGEKGGLLARRGDEAALMGDKPADKGGTDKNDPADKGGADKGGADKGGADKGGADKGGADKGGADKGGADKGGADKGGADKGGADKGDAPAGDDRLAGAKKALQGAVRAFDEAQQKREAAGVAWAGESAVVGGACARLYLADISPTDRAQLIEEATKLLDRAKDPDDVDVALARIGIAVSIGDVAGAQKGLADASNKLGSAGRGALGSYYWHKGMLALAARGSEAVDDLRRGALFRAGSADGGRLLTLAIRVACADPSGAPKDPKALEDRCLALETLLQQRLKGGRSRFGIDKASEAAAWNAVGIGYLNVPNPQKALAAFQAAGGCKAETLYYVNQAMALRVLADVPPKDGNADAHRRKCVTDAASMLADVGGKLDKERDKYAIDLLLVSAGLYHLANRNTEGLKPLAVAHDKFGLEDKEYFRTSGALADWADRLDLAVGDYKKAIALRHKDAYKMQVRVDKFERRR